MSVSGWTCFSDGGVLLDSCMNKVGVFKANIDIDWFKQYFISNYPIVSTILRALADTKIY